MPSKQPVEDDNGDQICDNLDNMLNDLFEKCRAHAADIRANRIGEKDLAAVSVSFGKMSAHLNAVATATQIAQSVYKSL